LKEKGEGITFVQNVERYLKNETKRDIVEIWAN